MTITLSSFTMRSALTTMALTLALLVLAMPVLAQDEGGDMKQEVNGTAGSKSSDQTTMVSYVGTAQQLARYAAAERDPVAMITAARILVQQNAADATTPDEESGQSDDSGATVPATAQGLLDAAQQLAPDDDNVSAMIADVEGMMEGERGGVYGPKRYTGNVGGSDREDTWNLGDFRGSEPARVIVDGDGDTDLDCYIYDENGNLIDSDTDTTDYCILGWTPAWTGGFRLRIRDYSNNGLTNSYVISHN